MKRAVEKLIRFEFGDFEARVALVVLDRHNFLDADSSARKTKWQTLQTQSRYLPKGRSKSRYNRTSFGAGPLVNRFTLDL